MIRTVELTIGAMSASNYSRHTPHLLPALTRLLAHCGVPSRLGMFGSLALTLARCTFLRADADAFFGQILRRRPRPYYVVKIALLRLAGSR